MSEQSSQTCPSEYEPPSVPVVVVPDQPNPATTPESDPKSVSYVVTSNEPTQAASLPKADSPSVSVVAVPGRPTASESDPKSVPVVVTSDEPLFVDSAGPGGPRREIVIVIPQRNQQRRRRKRKPGFWGFVDRRVVCLGNAIHTTVACVCLTWCAFYERITCDDPGY